MTWIAFFCCLLIILILLLILGREGLNELRKELYCKQSEWKTTVRQGYEVTNATFNKWLKVLNPAVYDILKGQRVYNSVQLFLLHGVLGESYACVTKTQIQKALGISNKTLDSRIKERFNYGGFSFDDYRKLNVFPQAIADDIIAVCR